MGYAIKDSKPNKVGVSIPSKAASGPAAAKSQLTKNGPGTNGAGHLGSHRYFPKKAK